MIVRQVLSRTVAFETESEKLEVDLRRLLRDFAEPADRAPIDLAYTVVESADTYTLVRDGMSRDGIAREEILVAITQELTAQWALRNDLAVVHAGAVVRDGRALLIAGPSGRGKTTLTAALVKRGFAYLSDELAALTTKGAVLRYATPLRVREGALARLGTLAPQLELWPTPASLWGEPLHLASPQPAAVGATEVARVGMVVFPTAPNDEVEPRLVDLPSGTAAFRIMAETLNYAACSRLAFDLALEVASVVSCHELVHGDVWRTVEAIERRW
jgi:hypothetical protein